MIYACLRFLQEWALPLTVVNYVLIGCASGLMLATGLAALVEPALARPLAALGCRSHPRRARHARREPRPQRAAEAEVDAADRDRREASAHRPDVAGLHGRLVQHARVLPRRVRGARAVGEVGFSVAVFPVPLALLAAGVAAQAPALLLVAFAVQYAGLLAERWFFFAQANHPQNLYYQRIS